MDEPAEHSCGICPKKFKTLTGLASHRKSHRSRFIACPTCKKPIKDLERHIRAVHRTAEPAAPGLDLRHQEELQRLTAKVSSMTNTAGRKNREIRKLQAKLADEVERRREAEAELQWRRLESHD